MTQALEREQIEKKLEQILEGLGEVFEQEDEEAYSDLLWAGFDDEEGDEYFEYPECLCIEDYLAGQAVQHEALHGMMESIVRQVTQYNDEAWAPLSPDSEWSAGAFFATHLALASDAYIPLFLAHFMTTEPGHEEGSYQFWGICKILARHGLQTSVLPLLIAPFFMDCSSASYFLNQRSEPAFGNGEVIAFLEDAARMDEFLQALAEMTRQYIPDPTPPAYYGASLFLYSYLSGALRVPEAMEDYQKQEGLVEAYRRAVLEEDKTPTIAEIQAMIDALV